MRQSLIVVALALLLASVALAGPDTGIAVPLPEALPAGTYELRVDVHGLQVLQGREAQQQLGVQVGLPYGFEVGIDVGFGGHADGWNLPGGRNWELEYNPDLEGWDNLWINVKKQVTTEGLIMPAIAVGAINLGATSDSDWWITAGKHFGSVQVCLGASDVGRDTVWYEAVSYQPRPEWKFIAEHTGGAPMSTNFGVQYRYAENWSGTLGYMRANDSQHDDALFLRLAYRDSFLW